MHWATLRDSPEAAIEHLSIVLPIFQTLGFKGLIAHCGLILSEANLAAGHLDEAERVAVQVKEVSEASDQRYWLGCAHRLLAEVQLMREAPLGRADIVASHLSLARRLVTECGAQPELVNVHRCLGWLKALQGDKAPARHHFDSAIGIIEEKEIFGEAQRVRAEMAKMI